MAVESKNIWFLSEVYFPDEQGTAFYTTGIAEGLAGTYNVHVLCSAPTVTARGSKVARKEIRNSVTIERCVGTTLNKDILPLRLINILTYSVTTLVKALVSVKKGDVVIAVTSPPSSPIMAKIVACCKGATCILRMEDVYPEILVATGMIRPKGGIDTCFGLLNKFLYKSADHIVVLGRDMKALAEQRIGATANHIQIIRSWADTDVITPAPKEDNALLKELGLTDKFVVSCVGNMGRAQAIEFIFEAISLLKDDQSIHFLFIGSGSKSAWVESEIRRRKLGNVTIVGQRPRNEQSCFIFLVKAAQGQTGHNILLHTFLNKSFGRAQFISNQIYCKFVKIQRLRIS